MKKANRLKKNEEFQQVFQRGYSVANRQFIVYQLEKTGQKNIRIGLSVSKKLGNAVVRNRIKRKMKEALREMIESCQQEKDVIIIARKPVVEMQLTEIKKSLLHVFKVGKLFKTAEQGRR